MSNLYVSLEEVKKILWKSKEEGIGYYVEEIGYLPNINLDVIDEMIEEYTGTQTMTDPLIVCALQELKQRLSTNK